MIFNTWLFAFFGAAVLLAYWWLVPRRWRPQFLIVAGLVFYSASIPAYTLLIVALSVVTYFTAIAIARTPADERSRRKILLALGVAASVGTLAVFKYSGLFLRTADPICQGGCHRFIPDLVVPLAISFFTFEFVHLLVDVYLGKIRDVGALDFSTFALFFPTLVAGPIKRFQNFVPQIRLVDRLDGVVVAAGIYRVLLGLAKKTIIADSMTPLTQPLIAPSALYGHADYWIGMLAYAAKIYFDFTGYSDIAIGFAALLGFQILENFDRPYWAVNISDFWRRWHISLSSWIRDYLFIPLGGSRAGKVRTFANLTAVMALAGLWHGAAWHFVVWGLWHGTGLALHRVWYSIVSAVRWRERLTGSAVHALSIAGTFLFVAFGWVLFASPTLHTAGVVFAQLLGFHPGVPPPPDALAAR